MTEDNEYQKATKIVVDDAMRIDILGPNVCKVLKEHNPTSEQVRRIVVTAIEGDVEVRKALTRYSEEQALTRKGEGLNKVQTIALTALITLIVTIGGTALYNQITRSSSAKQQSNTQR